MDGFLATEWHDPMRGEITQKQSLPKELQDQQAQAISLFRYIGQ
ncbi:hypothetical protein A9HBioS_2403 [Pseudomonas koreensis]|uniref:Uncharacterized protein n=1 Tax=Pseudomonas koreensis TaxID=198620 RepID=A0AA94EQW2_9PSED|nr:hypothetical protein A9HBioS_2403 [Pseudomonas koreensis]